MTNRVEIHFDTKFWWVLFGANRGWPRTPLIKERKDFFNLEVFCDNIRAALKGVPQGDIGEHKESRKGRIRCGRDGHRARNCRAFKTFKGTEPPRYPRWKPKMKEKPKLATAKRKRADSEDGGKPALSTVPALSGKPNHSKIQRIRSQKSNLRKREGFLSLI